MGVGFAPLRVLRPSFTCPRTREDGFSLPARAWLGRSYKEKPAAEGGSTAGQYRQCTYKYGFAKVVLQHLVALLEDPYSLGPVPPVAPPLREPRKGHGPSPSTFIDNTAKYRSQDEAKLRSTTLNLCLSFQRKPLIYAIYGATRRFRYYLLCSLKLRLHLGPGYGYDAKHGRDKS